MRLFNLLGLLCAALSVTAIEQVYDLGSTLSWDFTDLPSAAKGKLAELRASAAGLNKCKLAVRHREGRSFYYYSEH
jgi:hypothetical protein